MQARESSSSLLLPAPSQRQLIAIPWVTLEPDGKHPSLPLRDDAPSRLDFPSRVKQQHLTELGAHALLIHACCPRDRDIKQWKSLYPAHDVSRTIPLSSGEGLKMKLDQEKLLYRPSVCFQLGRSKDRNHK